MPGLAASSMTERVSLIRKCELNGIKIWPAIVISSCMCCCSVCFRHLPQFQLSPLAYQLRQSTLNCVSCMKYEYGRKGRLPKQAKNREHLVEKAHHQFPSRPHHDQASIAFTRITLHCRSEERRVGK